MADWSEMADAEPGVNGEHVSDALLSAFINNEIDDTQVGNAVGEHLARCTVCRREVQDLRVVVSLLAELPQPEPARSFRLTPAMVPARPLRRDPGYLRLQQGMRWAAAVAAVLLLLVFGTDIVIHRAGVPAADRMSTASQPFSAAERASEGPAGGAGGQTGGGPYSPAAEAPVAAGANEAPAAESPTARGNAGSAVPGAAMDSAPSATTLHAPEASPALETDEALPTIAAPAEPASTDRPMPSAWALAELALALVIVWLLVVSIALPRLYPWLRSRRAG